MSNSVRETSDGVPISDGFDFPVGPRGDNVDVFDTYKIDTTQADPAYFKSFNAWHTGEDWNGRGGGDTDLGGPTWSRFPVSCADRIFPPPLPTWTGFWSRKRVKK